MTFFIKRATDFQSDLVFGHAATSVQILKQDAGADEKYNMLLVSTEGRAWFIAREVPKANLVKLINLRDQIIADIKAGKVVIELDVTAL